MCLIMAITPGDYDTTQEKNWLKRLETVCQKNIDILQLREKHLNAKILFTLASKVRAITKDHNIDLFVNGRLDIALSVNADGVHFPTQGIPCQTMLPLIVGVSTHNLQEALDAEKQGAHYVSLSPIFPSPGKGAPLGLDILKQTCAALTIPVYALGGLSLEKRQACLNAGAAGIAGIKMFL